MTHRNGHQPITADGPRGRGEVCTKPIFNSKTPESLGNPQITPLKITQKLFQLRKSG
jgi:hypothetical protein